jgi:hypothetical protein
LFTDYEKASDSIYRQMLFYILKSRNIADTLLTAMVDIHINNKILIKSKYKLTKLAEINKAACQGCPLAYTV